MVLYPGNYGSVLVELATVCMVACLLVLVVYICICVCVDVCSLTGLFLLCFSGRLEHALTVRAGARLCPNSDWSMFGSFSACSGEYGGACVMLVFVFVDMFYGIFFCVVIDPLSPYTDICLFFRGVLSIVTRTFLCTAPATHENECIYVYLCTHRGCLLVLYMTHVFLSLFPLFFFAPPACMRFFFIVTRQWLQTCTSYRSRLTHG